MQSFPPRTEDEQKNWLQDLVAEAKRQGADEAEAVLMSSESVSVSVRQQALEQLQRAEAHGVGVRVMVGKQQALVSTSDLRPTTMRELVEHAVAMAKAMPPSPYLTLAEPSDYARSFEALDLYDAFTPSEAVLCDAAMRCEAHALDHPAITQSEGSAVGYTHSTTTLALSRGFVQTYKASHYSVGASVVAGEGDDMHVDGEGYGARHYADLPDPERVGAKAASLTVAHLHPRQVATQTVPVLFDPRVSPSLVKHFLSAINGVSVARGTSFLRDALHRCLTDYPITIRDNPITLRGLASRPFDAEGLPSRQQALLDKGVVATWLVDLERATQLGMPPTATAARGLSSAPSPSFSNVTMDAGQRSPEMLMADIKQGLYVTDLMGMGVSTVSGVYSQGARGYWIEDGKITFPVQELTIASDLRTMFRSMEPANDLVLRYRVNAPTIRIASMTVAGQLASQP